MSAREYIFPGVYRRVEFRAYIAYTHERERECILYYIPLSDIYVCLCGLDSLIYRVFIVSPRECHGARKKAPFREQYKETFFFFKPLWSAGSSGYI